MILCYGHEWVVDGSEGHALPVSGIVIADYNHKYYGEGEDMHSQNQDPAKAIYSHHIVPQGELTQVENIRYFEQYKKLYYTAYCLHEQMKQFQKINDEIEAKVDQVNRNTLHADRNEQDAQSQKPNKEKPKRFRRTNEMIERRYKCTYPKCDKAYASEGSLQQHIRLKHEDSPPQYHYHQRNVKREQRDYDSSASESSSEGSEEGSSRQARVKKQEES